MNTQDIFKPSSRHFFQTVPSLDLRADRGFSVIEVLFAIGLFATLSLAVSQLMVNSMSQVKQLNDRLALVDTEASLRTALGTASFCGCNFASYSIPSSPYPATFPVTSLDVQDASCAAATEIVQVGNRIGTTSFTTQSIVLRDIVSIGPGKISAGLEVTVSTPAGLAPKPISISNVQFSTVPVTATTSRIVACQIGSPLTMENVIVFDSDATWVVPANVSKIRIEAWGGGGGGGGPAFLAGTSAGGGGGGTAGSYGMGIYSVASGATLTIDVGAGGNGGSASLTGVDGIDGMDGQPSRVVLGASDLIFVGGGGSGYAATLLSPPSSVGCGTPPTTCAGAQVCTLGQAGGCGMWNYTSSTSAAGGSGGASPNGGGGGLGSLVAGAVPGGGGSGGVKFENTAGPYANGAQSGGSGASGRVIITY